MINLNVLGYHILIEKISVSLPEAPTPIEDEGEVVSPYISLLSSTPNYDGENSVEEVEYRNEVIKKNRFGEIRESVQDREWGWMRG